jgi:hypothetical protein
MQKILGRACLAGWLGCLGLGLADAQAPGTASTKNTADIMHPDEPTHLVIGYRAEPVNRADFRSYLESAEKAQLERWRRDGIILDYQILFMGITRFNDDADAVLIVTFPTYLGTYRWVEIERTMPGGLAAAGLKLGAPKWSLLADCIAHGEAAVRHPGRAAYEVSQYEFEDEKAYPKFALNYPAKMFRNWLDQGALSAYAIYTAQNGEGAPWNSFIVLEYKDRAAYSHSAQVKIRGYAQLAGDPGWVAAEKIRVAAKRKTHECFYESIASPIE